MSPTLINRLTYVVVAFVFLLGTAAAFGLVVEDGQLKQRVSLVTKLEPDAVINGSVIPTETKVEQVRVRTTLRDPSASDNAWILAGRLPVVLTISALAFLGLRFVANIAQRQPFASSSVWLLRIGAALLVISPFVKLLGNLALNHVFASSPIADLPNTGIKVSPGPLVAGLALFFVAEAFSRGRRAEKETEGLV